MMKVSDVIAKLSVADPDLDVFASVTTCRPLREGELAVCYDENGWVKKEIFVSVNDGVDRVFTSLLTGVSETVVHRHIMVPACTSPTAKA